MKIRETFKEYYYGYLEYLIENEQLLKNPHLLMEMPNLNPFQTGIKNVSVYIGPKPPNHRQLRIKVTIGGDHFRANDNVSIVLSRRPVIRGLDHVTFNVSNNQFAAILQWYEQNRELFHQLWNSQISPEQFEAQVQPYNPHLNAQALDIEDDEHD